MLKFFRKHLALLIIIVFTAIPVVRWFLINEIQFSFFDLTSSVNSLGKIFGLIGIALFSFNLILSARNKFFDRIFLGLNNLYNVHRAFGAISFSFILFHPLFLAYKFIKISLYQAALFFVPGQNLEITLGIIALLMMILIMVLTFYIKIKYQIWKNFHKFMVLVFGLIVLHVTLVSSDISRDGFLKYYILILAGVGLILGAYQAFIRKFINRDFSYEVQEVVSLNNKIVQLKISPTDKPLLFKPGQFAFIRLKGEGVNHEAHPFSFTSAPTANGLEFVIKALGDFTEKLKSLRPGARISVEGPFGGFLPENSKNSKQIWIAGGVGITPFLSLARSLPVGDKCNISLFYCVRSIGEAVLLDELFGIAQANGNLKVVAWCSDDTGRINGNKVAEVLSDFKDRDIFICGPINFMVELKKQFVRLGASRSCLHLEKFELK